MYREILDRTYRFEVAFKASTIAYSLAMRIKAEGNIDDIKQEIMHLESQLLKLKSEYNMPKEG